MSRKGENIYKRKDGRWEGRAIRCYDELGRAKYKSFYAASYSAVKAKLRAYSSSRPAPPAVLRGTAFAECAEKWLGTVKMRCRISTYNKYRCICANHILPLVGNSRVEEVTPEQVRRVVCSEAGLSAATRGDILCVVKMILGYARSCGYAAADISGLSVRQENRQMRVLSPEEQKTVTEYLLTDTDLCKIGVYLSLCTGIRIGELCALKRENISFESGLLSICGTMQRVQTDGGSSKTKVIISEPKSRTSARDIPLPAFASDFFRQYYSRLSCGAYLLTGSEDKFIEPRLLEYRFRKYMKDCRLYDVNFHALRHTFATRCVENGFEIKTLSEILGHINVNITLNRYVHSSIDLKRANMEKLNNVF